MHYYKRNIGDYHKKAGRLSMLQHGAYTLLMDACYDREEFPTREQAIEWCWADSPEEVAAVDIVLKRFFKLVDGRYEQGRVSDELEEYRQLCEKNGENGKKGGRPKKPKKTQTVTTGNPLETQNNPNKSESNPNQEPLTTNQEPETNKDPLDAKAPKPKRKTRLPDDFCLTDDRKAAAAKYWLDHERTDLIAATEFERFTAYHRSRGSTMVDWDAAWQTWYGNALKFNKPPNGSNGASHERPQNAADRRLDVARATRDYKRAIDF